MRFSSAIYLLLLPVVLWHWRGRAVRTGAGAVRCIVAVLLVMALAGPEVSAGRSSRSVMVVADQSASATSGRWNLSTVLASLSAGMGAADRAGLVVFGANAAVERSIGSRLDVQRVSATISTVDTDIEGALRLARRLVTGEPGARIVLVSDGLETRGDALDEARRALEEGIPIDVMAIPADAGGQPMVASRLAAPTSARVGDPVRMMATIVGTPGSRGELTVTSDQAPPHTIAVTVGDDGSATTEIEVRHDRAGLYGYRLEVRDLGDELGGTPSDAGAVVAVSGPPRLLYAGGVEPGIVPLLRSASFEVDRMPAGALPATAAGLSPYDAVLLDDVAEESLSRQQQEALLRYVDEQAGGVLLLGSPRSLSAEMPPDGPMARLLPVDVHPRQGGRTPSAALVLVFDRSGSMDDRAGGTTKIAIAREAVSRVLASVAATDALGVIAFNDRPASVAPLQRSHDPIELTARLRAVAPDGPTAIAPALALAAQWLREPTLTRETRRHVLLVSDGRTSAEDAARASAIARDSGFTLTTVALGAGSDQQFLAALAQQTGGRAYVPEDVRELPAILAREAARIAGGSVVEETFLPVASAHPILNRIPDGPLPALGGYAVTAAKPSSQSVIRSHLDDPVLATWQLGLGRVGVYTADLHASWSAPLRGWPEFPALMQQTVRWLSRPVEDGGLYASVEESSGSGVRLLVQAPQEDETSRAGLDVTAVVRGPDGSTSQLRLRERRPGHYEASIPAQTAGAYLFTIRASSRDGRFMRTLARGVHRSAEREFRRVGTDLAALRSLAAAAGGRMLAPGESAFDVVRPPSYQPLRWLIAFAAFLLFLGERLAPASSVAAATWWQRPRRTSALTVDDAA